MAVRMEMYENVYEVYEYTECINVSMYHSFIHHINWIRKPLSPVHDVNPPSFLKPQCYQPRTQHQQPPHQQCYRPRRRATPIPSSIPEFPSTTDFETQYLLLQNCILNLFERG